MLWTRPEEDAFNGSLGNTPATPGFPTTTEVVTIAVKSPNTFTGWGITSILGAQNFLGRLEDISQEWRLNTAAKVKEGNPTLYKLLTDPKYAFPTRLPDGKYNPQPWEKIVTD